MHRSGTSLVSGLLSCMGAYMDPDWPCAGDGEAIVPPGPLLRRNGYGEAAAFRLLNERLMSSAGADWDNPDPFLAIRDRALFASRSLLAIQSATFGSLRRGYLRRATQPHPATWGWKDPRNSLTLPYWLHAFPDARVIHVRRDAGRVADSLIRRAEAQAATATVPGVAARLRRLATDPAYLAGAVRRRLFHDDSQAPEPRAPLDRGRCIDLAHQYVEECVRYRALGEQYLEIRYEDLVRDPEAMTAQVAEFANLASAPGVITRAATLVTRTGAQQPSTSMERQNRA
jgi:hypothetical protein